MSGAPGAHASAAVSAPAISQDPFDLDAAFAEMAGATVGARRLAISTLLKITENIDNDPGDP